MVLSNVAGHARFYDLGGTAVEEVPSEALLSLPQGETPQLGHGVSQAYWSDRFGHEFGLVEYVGPSAWGRPWAGFISHGYCPDAIVHVELTANLVFVGPNEGFDVGVTVVIERNGIVIGSAPYTNHSPSWVIGTLPDVVVHLTGVSLVPDDILVAGMQVDAGWVGIGKMPAGAGEGDVFYVSGLFTSGLLIPGQPPMRLHGVVGDPL